MYRRVLPLLLTAVLLLSGCTAGQKNIPQKTDEKERTGQPSDMSGEGSMYMDTTENVIYCLLYTSPSPRDAHESRMPSSA